MQKQLFILFTVFCFTFGYNGVYAQEVKEPEYKAYKELEINGEVYIYKYILGIISPKKNKVKGENTTIRCPGIGVREKPNDEFELMVRKVFDRDRIAGLTKNNVVIRINFACDREGNVLEMIFFLSSGLLVSQEEGENSLSLKEVDALYKELEKYQFSLVNTCPDVEHYHINRLIRFRDF